MPIRIPIAAGIAAMGPRYRALRELEQKSSANSFTD
jgi:hypothetical protein